MVFLAVLSAIRSYVWMSDERLWREAEEALQLLARRAASLLRIPAGKASLSEGNAAASLPEFGRGLALNPRDALNYKNGGVALMAFGQRDAARQDFRRALQLDPDLTAARRNPGRLGW